MENEELSVASFFSGAGGFDLGFADRGFKIAFANDIWSDACESFSMNHKGVKVFEKDIHTLSKEDMASAIEGAGISSISVAIGGPPCQCFTRLNNEFLLKKKKDARRELFNEYIKKIELLQPKLIFMENVRDLIVRKDGRGTPYDKIITRKFKKAGYFSTYFILNAANYDVPQERHRILFVATNDESIKKKILNSADYFEKISKQPKPVKDFLKTVSGKKNLLNQEVTENGHSVSTRIRHIPQGGYYEHLPTRLKTKKIRDGKEVVVKRYGSYLRRLHNDKPAKTITKNYVIHPTENRYLTNREKAVLHTFPEDYAFHGGIWSVSQQIANAVPPNFAKAIADYAVFLLT